MESRSHLPNDNFDLFFFYYDFIRPSELNGWDSIGVGLLDEADGGFGLRFGVKPCVILKLFNPKNPNKTPRAPKCTPQDSTPPGHYTLRFYAIHSKPGLVCRNL